MNTDWHDLIQRHIAGLTTDEEAAHLQDSLQRDDAVAQLYLRYMNLDVALEGHASSSASMSEMLVSPTHGETRRWTSWLSWRPVTAAAAGLVIGLFCASVVFAYVAPPLGKVVALLDDSFESGPAPLVTGIPVEPGRWSGDFTEVVGEQQGVSPESGKKMLRFLRADYEGKPNAEASRVADIYRLIDVRSYRQELADGSAVVQLSAAFNAFEYPLGETYIGTITIHALDAGSVTNGSLRALSARDDTSLAVASTGLKRLDRNPESWQRLTGDLRVPANTDFLLIHILIPAGRGTLEKAGFGGHYIDDVRLTLRRSPLR
jgi:hypothetical protein